VIRYNALLPVKTHKTNPMLSPLSNTPAPAATDSSLTCPSTRTRSPRSSAPSTRASVSQTTPATPRLRTLASPSLAEPLRPRTLSPLRPLLLRHHRLPLPLPAVLHPPRRLPLLQSKLVLPRPTMLPRKVSLLPLCLVSWLTLFKRVMRIGLTHEGLVASKKE
jgi:hypothetical protein